VQTEPPTRQGAVANPRGSRYSSIAANAVRQRVRATLVVAQLALAVLLLTGGGLVLRSFQKLGNVDLGLDSTATMSSP